MNDEGELLIPEDIEAKQHQVLIQYENFFQKLQLNVKKDDYVLNSTVLYNPEAFQEKNNIELFIFNSLLKNK